MRSDLVHSATKRLPNRFMLCRMAALAARRLHSYKRHYAASINQGLTQIADLTPAAAAAAGDSPDATIPVHSELECDTVEVR